MKVISENKTIKEGENNTALLTKSDTGDVITKAKGGAKPEKAEQPESIPSMQKDSPNAPEAKIDSKEAGEVIVKASGPKAVPMDECESNFVVYMGRPRLVLEEIGKDKIKILFEAKNEKTLTIPRKDIEGLYKPKRVKEEDDHNDKLPPDFVIKKIEDLKKSGKSNEEISNQLKITLDTVNSILKEEDESVKEKDEKELEKKEESISKKKKVYTISEDTTLENGKVLKAGTKFVVLTEEDSEEDKKEDEKGVKEEDETPEEDKDKKEVNEDENPETTVKSTDQQDVAEDDEEKVEKKEESKKKVKEAENDPKDNAEDEKLAKEAGKTKDEWESSKEDELHDKKQESSKKIRTVRSEIVEKAVQVVFNKKVVLLEKGDKVVILKENDPDEVEIKEEDETSEEDKNKKEPEKKEESKKK